MGVVDFINQCSLLKLGFPTLQEKKHICEGYKRRSSIKLPNIIGSIDGMLVWVKKPSLETSDDIRCGQVNFYCSRKVKYGMNLQAICDHNLIFRWIDIRYPGSSSDYISWCTSKLCIDLEKKWSEMILPGCTLLGDSAYVKKPYMAVPIKKGKLQPYEDGYNCYLSQLRVTIECAFGVLVNRWSILRRPLCFNLERIGPLVMCLCRLHNFCIQKRLRTKLSKRIDLKMLDMDQNYTMSQCRKHNVNPVNLNNEGVPTALLQNQNPEVEDIPSRCLQNNPNEIPMNVMLEKFKRDGIQRPNIVLPRARKKKKY